MGSKGCVETSIRNCHYLLRNNREERSSREFLILPSANTGLKPVLQPYYDPGQADVYVTL